MPDTTGIEGRRALSTAEKVLKSIAQSMENTDQAREAIEEGLGSNFVTAIENAAAELKVESSPETGGVMTRSEFERLSQRDRMDFVLNQGQVVPDDEGGAIQDNRDGEDFVGQMNE